RSQSECQGSGSFDTFTIPEKRVEVLSTKWKTGSAKIKAIPNTPG
ncbi:unnamed protein product, partial [marine sediment metagenome]